MIEEVWKQIENYEDYEISNYGRVRRIRYDNKGNKGQYPIPNYLKPKIDKDGYIHYTLCVKQKNKLFSAHKLVALNYIPNPLNKPQINHIDGNKQNNYVGNLEWCTQQENNLHALRTGLRVMKNNKLSKVVEQYDLNGNLINEYKSSGDAGRINNISSSHIRDCCRGRLKTYKKYIWKYKSK